MQHKSLGKKMQRNTKMYNVKMWCPLKQFAQYRIFGFSYFEIPNLHINNGGD